MTDPQKKLFQIEGTVEGVPPKVSFEFFPPRTEKGLKKLKENIAILEKLNPHFVSVTYGAGGTTKELTYDIVKYIKENTSLNPAAHLTCVNAPREEINQVAKSYLDIGVNRIVALRGDMPGFEGEYKPHPDGYAYANDLVKGLKELGDFDISVAAYPEVHPQAPSPEFDLEHLRNKVDAGANRAVTQYCFDTEKVIKFIKGAKNAGITVPIVPGVVTINGFEQLISFSKRCGASIPDWMHELFAGADSNPEKRDEMAISIAAEQCRLLMAEGIDQFHFYTLNRADLTVEVCRKIGIK